MTETDCMLCDLIGSDAPVSMVDGNDLVVSFPGTYPVAPGHVLVMPRRHVTELAALTAEDKAAL